MPRLSIRQRLITLATAVGVVAALTVGAADATPDPVGYTTSSFTGNEQLWQLDVRTGASALVGATGLPPVTVLAFTPANTLYGINYSTRRLYTIDPSTASPTEIGFTGSRGGTQLAATGDGKLWSTIGSPDQPSDLYQVNPSTGQATLVGPIDQGWVTGIAGTCSGHLFGYSAGNLLSIDPATGAGSVIGATGLTSQSLLISFDQDEHLWGVGGLGAPGTYRLDTDHGTATFVAHITSDFSTLAFPRTCHH